MTDRNGVRWQADEIKARTELVLDGRFAKVLTVNEWLSAVDQPAAGRQAA
jgi:hypothetical protein